MRYLFIVALAASTAISAEFSTRPAQQAEAIYNREMRAAEEYYAKAKAAAHRKYVKSLDDAAKAAAVAGNLDEVAKIGAEKQRLGAEAQSVDGRTLWVHDRGFFQRLNDGEWVERQPNGTLTFLREVSRSEKHVEIELSGARIRLGDSSSVVSDSPGSSFRKNYDGEWR